MAREPVATAATELVGIARFTFHEGKVGEFKRLSARCMEIVRTEETGTLQYDIFFNDDQSEAVVVERFRDSDALIKHAENMAEISEAVLKTADVEGELLGDPSAEIREKLVDGEQPRLFTPYLSL